MREIFHYSIEGNDIGECWGVAAHPNGDCTVREGSFAGRKLSELWKKEPQLFGNIKKESFPLLVKIIDAKEDLSIQVHPDDVYAKVNEKGSLGKTECWYIIDCPKEASLVIGHQAKNKAELKEMISDGRWKEFIREIPVKKGDFIQIAPGTVHAIKGGIMLLETQQNSDITYRVYDYGRLADGKPRELHLEKSLDVISVPARPAEEFIFHTSNLEKNKLCLLYSCEYYRVFKLNVDKKMIFEQTYPFFIISILEGEGVLNGKKIKKGDHMILPNKFGTVEIQGKLKAICSSI